MLRHFGTYFKSFSYICSKIDVNVILLYMKKTILTAGMALLFGFVQAQQTANDYLVKTKNAKKVAVALKAAFPCKKVAQVVLGLEVPHAHIHLIPMQSEADVDFRKEKLQLTEEEFKAIADKIYKEFSK